MLNEGFVIVLNEKQLWRVIHVHIFKYWRLLQLYRFDNCEHDEFFWSFDFHTLSFLFIKNRFGNI